MMLRVLFLAAALFAATPAHARHRHHAPAATATWFGSDLVAAARHYLGTNPTGWRHVWCGKFMSLIAPQAAARIRNPNLARNWARLPHVHGCRVGAVAVMPHHVGVVSGCEGRRVRIVSGNHNHRVGEGDYPARRIMAYVEVE